MGAFKSLFSEWVHPEVPIDDLEYQKRAIEAAMNNDYGCLFNIENCKGKYTRPADLYNEYMKLIQ